MRNCKLFIISEHVELFAFVISKPVELHAFVIPTRVQLLAFEFCKIKVCRTTKFCDTNSQSVSQGAAT